MCNLNSPRTLNVEGEGEEGRGAVPGRLTAVRKSLEMGRGRGRRKAAATGGMSVSQAKRLKELEKENERLV